MDKKYCSMCGELKILDDYYKQNKKRKDGTPYIYYHPECKECTKKQTDNWRLNNPERWRQIQVNQYYNNADKWRSYKRELNKSLREDGTTLEWQRNNKDKIKGYNFNRQSKNHKISNMEWENCKKYFNHRCAYCGLTIEEHWIRFNGEIRLGDFHREHVDDKGSNDLSNCVPACKTCNTSKHTFELHEWYDETNPNFTQERLDKIYKWLEEDYKKYIKV